MIYLSIDFETRSAVDLRATGVYRYAEDPSTDVWCMAWAFGDEEPEIWRPGEPVPARVAEWVGHGNPMRAWNANFERVVWNTILAQRYGFPTTTREQWYCSAAEARAMALPGDLGGAAMVLGVEQQKDTAGRRLMLQMSKPRRILPDGKPEWWNTADKVRKLMDYCLQDVRTERAVAAKVSELATREREVFLLDQTINDRGVQVDRALVLAAQDVAARAVDKANSRLREITQRPGAAVTNVGELLDWIRSRGIDSESLDKQAVAVLKREELPADVAEAIRLREECGKSSVAKLSTMLDAACADGRIRGLLLYHGAATGRWAGRLVQPQNFPRGNVDKPEQFIPAVLAGDVDLIDLHYAPLEVVSAMLRAMLVASPGRLLVAADFAAIEARVLAWLADEREMLETFRTGGDVYKAMASKVYDKPVAEITKPERQLGKMCLGPDTRVITQRGTIRIVDVTQAHLLWDGESWVTHDGLVCNGQRPTMTHQGLTATPDHEVLTGAGWREFHEVAENPALWQSARALVGWLSFTASPECATDTAAAGLSSADAIAAASRECTPTTFNGPSSRSARDAQRGPQTVEGSPSSLTRSRTQRTATGFSVDCLPQSADATDQTTPRTSTTVVEALPSTRPGDATARPSCDMCRRLLGGTTRRSNSTASTLTADMNPATSASSRTGRTTETSDASQTSSTGSESWSCVYDIANAGPRNRFAVLTDDGPILVHNCVLGLGYGMGPAKFIDSCKTQGGITLAEDEARRIVKIYRDSNRAITGLWRDLENAARNAVDTPGDTFPVAGGRVRFVARGGYLWMLLPSGRKLAYSKPVLAERTTPWGSQTLAVRVWGQNSVTRRWEQYDLYSGLIAENAVQAIAADVLFDAMLRVENVGLPIVLSVHDEVVCEVDEARADYKELERLMSVVPAWAPGLPLSAEGWQGPRYRK